MTSDECSRSLTTLRWVPDMVSGLVRDIRVRWALEEAGLPYRIETVDFGEKDLPAYRILQPFGQVPVYRDGDVTMFESGAIVHHIAMQSANLMPNDAQGRAHTLEWMFAALNSIEPVVVPLAEIDLFEPDAGWARAQRPAVLTRLESKLADLDRVLAGRAYLISQFTGADILMATVLNILRHTTVVAQYPHLAAYHQRCLARPAAQKAAADQRAFFAAAAAPDPDPTR